MSGRALSRALAGLLLVAAPLVFGPFAPARGLPAGVAFALGSGRWLVLAVGVAAALALLLEESGLDPWRAASLARADWTWPRWAAVGLALWAAAVALVPATYWTADQLAGDEPKYLREADSLASDLDVDLSSSSLAPPRLSDLPRNLRSLGRATRRALGDLLADPRPDSSGHAWQAGHWTIQGLHGGTYHVQAPGLPALLVPARLLQGRLDPERPNSLVLLTLAGLWAVAVYQAARLGSALAGSPLLGLAGALALGSAAPLLSVGRHVYPEIACAAALAWLARRVLPGQPRPRPAAALAGALLCGALPWLHVKFSLLAVLALVLLLLRLGPGRLRLACTALAALPVAALLLFDHHVTGLLRPDAFYLRAASPVYSGPGDLFGRRVLVGLGVALFGAREGLLVMAPAAAAALLAWPAAWARQRQATGTLLLLAAALWLPTGLHGGGAPGPPGRLMAPVLLLLAPILSMALPALIERRAFRFTLAALLLAGLALSVTQWASWRRMVDPWEGLFASRAEDFSRLLPDAPPTPGERLRLPSPGAELLRALVPALALAAWAAWLGRAREALAPRPALRALLAWSAAAWGTVALVTGVLGLLRGGA